MNKRIRKKYNKRLNCKKYLNYRHKRILQWIDENRSEGEIIFVFANENCKRITKIKKLINIMPTK